MAGLLQCVVTRRADEPIHLSQRDREREREKEEGEREEETESLGYEEARGGERANGALPTRFLCGPQLCCFLGLRNETLPANNPTRVLILRRRVYASAP